MSTEDAGEATSVLTANEEADEKEYQQLLRKFKRQFGGMILANQCRNVVDNFCVP